MKECYLYIYMKPFRSAEWWTLISWWFPNGRNSSSPYFFFKNPKCWYILFHYTRILLTTMLWRCCKCATVVVNCSSRRHSFHDTPMSKSWPSLIEGRVQQYRACLSVHWLAKCHRDWEGCCFGTQVQPGAQALKFTHCLAQFWHLQQT